MQKRNPQPGTNKKSRRTRLLILLCALSCCLFACAAETAVGNGDLPDVGTEMISITLPPEPSLLPTPFYPSPSPSPEARPVPTPVPTPKPTPKVSPTPEFPLKTFKYEPAGYVIGHEVNLRKGPGTKYSVIDELDYLDTVKLLAESGDWYYVEFGKKKGFVSQEFVKIGDVEEAKATPTPKATKKPSSTPKATAKPTNKPTRPGGKYTEAEIYMAAQMIYLEARDGPYEEYLAVASVLYNRIHSSRFPDTVEGNIFAENQFSVAKNRDKFLSAKPDSDCIKAAEQVLNGAAPTVPSDVMYFRAARKGTVWNHREYYATIGNHCFYK